MVCRLLLLRGVCSRGHGHHQFCYILLAIAANQLSYPAMWTQPNQGPNPALAGRFLASGPPVNCYIYIYLFCHKIYRESFYGDNEKSLSSRNDTKLKSVSRLFLSDSASLWTVYPTRCLSMEFSRQEYRSELPFDLHTHLQVGWGGDVVCGSQSALLSSFPGSSRKPYPGTSRADFKTTTLLPSCGLREHLTCSLRSSNSFRGFSHCWDT